MRIDILTLFPGLFSGPLSESLTGKAIEKGLLNVNLHDIRRFAEGKHDRADDSPYGGGPGMVMMAEPILKAVQETRKEAGRKAKLIIMSPSGRVLSQEKIIELSKEEGLIIICGRYEGVDERLIEKLEPEEISIGDYVLTGGELPAMVLVDAVSRHIPGVIKEGESVKQDSFYNGLLDWPSYTRPEKWQGIKVPDVLLSGDHKKIEEWRREQAVKRTFFKRPDLLKDETLSDKDKDILKGLFSKK